MAEATAEGLRPACRSDQYEGVKYAGWPAVAEQYVREFGKLARQTTPMILPA